MESGGNFEDYIRFLSYQLFCPVNHGQNWKGWERNGKKTCLSVSYLKDIMDKFYGKNQTNKTYFFNSPDSPEHSDQDSVVDV